MLKNQQFVWDVIILLMIDYEYLHHKYTQKERKKERQKEQHMY